MRFLILFACFTALQAFLFDRKVCYDDLGCFDTQTVRSLSRPIVLLPSEPTKIATRFFLYSRQNPTKNEEQEITRKDADTIDASNFNSSRPIKFIIHGFTHNTHLPWVQEMIKQLLVNGDFNIIAVDWRNGAGFPYTQAVANARVVGMEIVKLIDTLKAGYGVDVGDIHIIGHSIGAHIASEVGTKQFGLGRISGLDPAEPYFEGAVETIRLDPRDALFVDVIHSDGSAFLGSLGMGYRSSIGHVDFYPNGGGDQPGCEKGAGSKLTKSALGGITKGWSGLTSTFACSHEKSIAYYIESINTPCPFVAYPCKSYDDFKAGKCLKCGASDGACNSMGYNADKSSGRGNRYLLTNLKGSAPYCAYHYKVAVTAGIMDKDGWGKVQLLFGASKGQSYGPFAMSDQNVRITSQMMQTRMIATGQPMKNIDSVKVTYNKGTCLTCFLNDDFFRLQKVQIFNGEDNKETNFCGKNISIAKEQIRTLSSETMGATC